jgi:hypothetical protein
MKKSELQEIVREAIAQAASQANSGEKVSTDAQTADLTVDKSPAVSRALSRINTSAEFEDLFVKFIGNLGIKSSTDPDKTKIAVSKGTVIAAVNRALEELDWK